MKKTTDTNTRKRQTHRLLYFLLILPVVLFGIAGFFFYRQQKAEESAVHFAKLKARQAQITYEGTDLRDDSVTYIQCRKDGQVDDGIVEIVNQQLSLLPENIHNLFTNDEWSVYVTDMDIDKTYYEGKYGKVMATTNYNEKRILIESRLDAAYESPIHEIGHWFDVFMGLVTDLPEFDGIYEAEAGTFIQIYGSDCIRDKMEFFAEGFWQYILNPGRLKSVCPDLYQFIKTEYCRLCVWTTWYQYHRFFAGLSS